tara:strand:- start:242 stop:469 length:228 start_codon:yes stop_codon:yes gene_type:complete
MTEPKITQERVEIINRLIEIESQIQDLWEFHPDNPESVDIVSRFDDLQRDAASIDNYLQTLFPSKDNIEEEELPF